MGIYESTANTIIAPRTDVSIKLRPFQPHDNQPSFSSTGKVQYGFGAVHRRRIDFVQRKVDLASTGSLHLLAVRISRDEESTAEHDYISHILALCTTVKVRDIDMSTFDLV